MKYQQDESLLGYTHIPSIEILTQFPVLTTISMLCTELLINSFGICLFVGLYANTSYGYHQSAGYPGCSDTHVTFMHAPSNPGMGS